VSFVSCIQNYKGKCLTVGRAEWVRALATSKSITINNHTACNMPTASMPTASQLRRRKQNCARIHLLPQKRTIVKSRTVVVDLDRDVFWWCRVISHEHERSPFLLRRKADQNVLLIGGYVSGGSVELVANHVARLHHHADLCATQIRLLTYLLTKAPQNSGLVNEATDFCDRVQTRRRCSQGAPRLCTVVPWRPVHLRCRPSKSPRASLFLQRLPRPASGSPFHCWQPSIFGCWPQANCLPLEVTSAPSLATFRTRLKTFLFTESYPDIQLI